MFVQIIEAQVKDAGAVEAQKARWSADLKPGAVGYVGSTGGITDDGRLILAARFESPEAAQANSDRPEQGAWWDGMAPLLDDITFRNCEQTDVFLGGGSDDAGFVQVIQGKADRDQIQPLAAELDAFLKRARPDLIGGQVSWHGDGGFTQFVYFRTEDEAREGEGRELSPEDAAMGERIQSLMTDMSFLDLRHPWLDSA